MKTLFIEKNFQVHERGTKKPLRFRCLDYVLYLAMILTLGRGGGENTQKRQRYFGVVETTQPCYLI